MPDIEITCQNCSVTFPEQYGSRRTLCDACQHHATQEARKKGGAKGKGKKKDTDKGLTGA